jgi:O-antigen/teichoic acid export membrane protein
VSIAQQISKKAPEKKERSSRLLPVANVAVSHLNSGVSMAASFLITPAMLVGLGDDRYGGWLLLNSFISYMRFLDLGTSAATVKYGAGALERGDDADLRKILNSTSAIFVIVGTLAMIATLTLTFVLPRIYPSIASDQSSAILMLGSALAIDLFSRTFAAALRTRSLFFVYDALQVVSFAIFKLGLLLYFAYQGGLSYRLLGALTLAEAIFRDGLVMIAALVITPFVRRVNPLSPARDMMKKLTAMGLAMSLIQVAEILRFQVDAGVIGYFMPESPISISIFGVGTRLASIAYGSIGVIGSVLMPRFSGLSETGDQKGVKALLERASLATGLAASLVLVNLAVLGPQFLELWLKKPWVSISGKVLLLMLPAYFVTILAGPSAELLVGRGKLRGLTAICVGEAIANLVLSIALVKPFGIFGVALGTVVPMIVVRGIVFPLLLKRELGLPPSEYARMNARPVFVGLVYLVLVGGLAFVPLVSYARFFLLSAVSVLVFVILVFGVVPETRGALSWLLAKLRWRTVH